jgi:hypothetical protein
LLKDIVEVSAWPLSHCRSGRIQCFRHGCKRLYSFIDTRQLSCNYNSTVTEGICKFLAFGAWRVYAYQTIRPIEAKSPSEAAISEIPEGSAGCLPVRSLACMPGARFRRPARMGTRTRYCAIVQKTSSDPP